MSKENQNIQQDDNGGEASVQLFDDKAIESYLQSDITAIEDAATLINLSQNDPNLLNDPEIGKLLGMADNLMDADKNKQQNLNGDDDQEDDAEGAAGKNDEGAEEEEEEEAEEENQVFVTGKKTGKKSLDNVTAENYNEILAQELNIEIKDDEAAKKLVGSIRKFRSDSQKLTKVAKENDEFKQFYQSLPKKLLVALNAYVKNEDYEAALTNYKPSIDFSKPFNTLSDDEKVSTLSYYYPNLDTQGKTLTDPDLQKLLPNLERLYSAEKTSYDISVAAERDKANQHNAAFATAVKASADAFATEYSDVFTKNTITSLTRQLESGKWKDVLFDQNGLPKADAIKRLAYLVYGEDYVQQVKAGTASTKKSKQTAQTIKTQPKTPIVKKNQNTLVENESVLKELEMMRDTMQKQVY